MAHRYTPLYRPMDSYMMNACAAGNDWQYVEACHDWPMSPHPRSLHRYGVFQTAKPLTADQREQLQVKEV